MPPDVAALAAAYARAQEAVKAATEHKDTLAAQLKAACETAALGAGRDMADTRVELEGEGFVARVTPVESWRVDTTKLKSEQPHLYAAYAKKSTSLRLEVVPA
jgi:predicted phage-related endonuclease